MKKIHYRNLGYPKSGTTWLYAQLRYHPQVDAKLQDYYKEFTAKSLDEYKSLYQDYNISANCNPRVFTDLKAETHHEHPTRINEYTTHLTVCFRNVYDVLNSLFNMKKNMDPNFKMTEDNFIHSQSEFYKNNKKIFEYWNECKIPIKFMFYDDLVNDPKKYFYDVCDYIGIKRSYKDIGIKFKTDVKHPLAFDNKDIINYINDSISVIEEYTKRNLSHWKK
jgi:hypothetical protein